MVHLNYFGESSDHYSFCRQSTHKNRGKPLNYKPNNFNSRKKEHKQRNLKKEHITGSCPVRNVAFSHSVHNTVRNTVCYTTFKI